MRTKGRTKIEAWLKVYSYVLNISALEREIGTEKGKIQKFIKYDRNLSNLKYL